MSKEEMVQIIESQRKEIQYLQKKAEKLEEEKVQMVDNFQKTTFV